MPYVFPASYSDHPVRIYSLGLFTIHSFTALRGLLALLSIHFNDLSPLVAACVLVCGASRISTFFQGTLSPIAPTIANTI